MCKASLTIKKKHTCCTFSSAPVRELASNQDTNASTSAPRSWFVRHLSHTCPDRPETFVCKTTPHPLLATTSPFRSVTCHHRDNAMATSQAIHGSRYQNANRMRTNTKEESTRRGGFTWTVYALSDPKFYTCNRNNLIYTAREGRTM